MVIPKIKQPEEVSLKLVIVVSIAVHVIQFFTLYGIINAVNNKLETYIFEHKARATEMHPQMSRLIEEHKEFKDVLDILKTYGY